eukprot:scaffold5430_cov153-Pinguiococcus_pyrenoidosus.AAC.1
MQHGVQDARVLDLNLKREARGCHLVDQSLANLHINLAGVTAFRIQWLIVKGVPILWISEGSFNVWDR